VFYLVIIVHSSENDGKTMANKSGQLTIKHTG